MPSFISVIIETTPSVPAHFTLSSSDPLILLIIKFSIKQKQSRLEAYKIRFLNIRDIEHPD